MPKANRKREARQRLYPYRLSPYQYAILRDISNGTVYQLGDLYQNVIGYMIKRGLLSGSNGHAIITREGNRALDIYYLNPAPVRMAPGEITEHVSRMLSIAKARDKKAS